MLQQNIKFFIKLIILATEQDILYPVKLIYNANYSTNLYIDYVPFIEDIDDIP